MLFHVTLSHTVDNCPIYQKEMFPKVIEAAEGLEGLAKELNVKIHFLQQAHLNTYFSHCLKQTLCLQ